MSVGEVRGVLSRRTRLRREAIAVVLMCVVSVCMYVHPVHRGCAPNLWLGKRDPLLAVRGERGCLGQH